MQPKTKNNIAIAIAILFHVCGVFGILFSPYKSWFISNTSLNLLLMFGLLIFTQPAKNIWFFLFALITFIIGFGVEVIGVNTGVLFGSYTYGNVMGVKLWGVPVLIGVQWFVTVYCCGVIMHYVNNWAAQKIEEQDLGKETTQKIQSLSLIIDAALLATFFDFVLEPAAQKLGYWKWQDGSVPYFNYTCWFFISGLLLFVLSKMPFNKLNPFAIHLFIIQVLFFVALRIYL